MLSRHIVPVLALTCASLVTPQAFGQAARHETVVVTANYIGSNDFKNIPAIRLVKRADQVLFSFTLTSGSRDAKERDQELEKSYDDLIAQVAKTSGVDIMAGSPESQARIETATFKELVRYNYQTQRSSIDLVLLFDVLPDESFNEIRKRADEFIKKIKYSGRAEGFADDEQFLSLSNADQYRLELLKQIADDARMMQITFGHPSEIHVDGLNNPVSKQPAGALSIMLYIPYSMSIDIGGRDG